MGIIYSIENKINGKFYIGQTNRTLNKRKMEHNRLHCKSSVLERAIRKYGKYNFEWKIIDRHDNQDVLNMLERLYISRYESLITQWGYNIRDGGYNGKFTQKTKEKMSESKIGENNSFYGRKHSLDSLKKNSDAQCGKYPGAHYQRGRNPETRRWQSNISYKGHRTSLGLFEDPLTASLIYQLVKDELYGVVCHGTK